MIDPAALADLASAVAGASAKAPRSSEHSATVVRVDAEGTTWVRIPGGADETPVSRAYVEALPGDTVRVSISGGRATMTGNLTSPAATTSTVAAAVAPVERAGLAMERRIEADTARIGELEAENVTVSGELRAQSANIYQLQADYAELGDVVAGKVDADELDAQVASIADARISQATIEQAQVRNLSAEYAKADLANVTNAYIDRGVFNTAAIVDEQVFTVTGNKATLAELDASKVNVTNLQAKSIQVEKINGVPVTGKSVADALAAAESEIDGVQSDVSALDSKLDSAVDTLNGRIDAQIETFTAKAVPTLSNYPASDWSTDKLRAEHVGDICYVVNAGSSADGYTYRFARDESGAYSWVLIKDNQVTAALQRLLDAEGNISGLQSFETEVSSWKTDTDAELSSLKSSNTTLTTTVGKTLVATTQLWFTKANTTAPGKPTAQVTTSDASKANQWNLAVPTYSATYPNYFYCYQWQYADGTYGWSAVTRDIATGEAQSTARTASSTATTAKSTADAAASDASAAKADASTAKTDAATAKGDASAAKTDAAAAKSDASTAKTDAATAKSDASTAKSTASTAKSTADTAKSTADTAKATADKNVRASIQLWFTKANETAPAKPTAKVTSDSTAGNAWRTVVPTYSATYPSYFYCWQYELADGTFTWSDVVYDRATTENERNAHDALTQLTTKVETSTFNEVKQTVDENSATITQLTTKVEGKADGSTVTTLTNTVNEVKQTATSNSSKISSLETVNSKNGLTESTNITQRTSAIEQDLSGFKSTVSSTYATQASLTAEANQRKAAYVTSSTAAGTAAKVGTCANFALYTGARIACTFTTANTAATPTLNVNSTGAKQIRSYTGAALTEAEYKWAAGASFDLVYDGTYWRMQDAGVVKRVTQAETSITQNSEAIALRATKAEAYQVAQPNLSPFFSRLPYNATAGEGGTYWQSWGTGTHTSMGNGWMRKQCSNTGTSVLYSQNRPKSLPELSSETVYTLLAEFRNVNNTGNVYLRCPDGGQSGIAGNIISGEGTRSGIDLKVANGAYHMVFKTPASTATNYSTFFGICVRCDAGATADFEMRVSIYEGEYSGPYKPYSGPQLYASQAELKVANDSISTKVEKNGVISSINQSSESVKIQASKVEVDGTAVFNAAKSKLDAAYDAKGAASTAESNAKAEAAKAINAAGGFDILWNRAEFASDTNAGGECYLCAYDPTTGTRTDANGWAMWNGTKRTITKGMFNPNAVLPYNIPAYIVCRLSSATATTGTNYMVWYNSGWKSGPMSPSSSTVTDWTWAEATDMVLGKFVEPGSEAAFTECETYRQPLKWGTVTTDTVTARSANAAAAAAQSTANNAATKATAVTKTQRIYYRKSASGAPATPGTASSNWVTQEGNVSNAWTKMHLPISSTEKYIYTCEQYQFASGTVGYTAVLLDNTITVIDGGNIITGSVTANQIAASAVTADKIAASAVTSAKIAAGAVTADKVAAKSLTVGAFTDSDQSSILNSNVSVGGRNLLGATENPSTPTSSNGEAISTFKSIGRYNSPQSEYALESYDGFANALVITSTATGNRGVGWYTKAGEVVRGQQYTFSCRVKSSVAVTAHTHTAWRNGSATATYTGWTAEGNMSIPANTWTDYSCTLTPNASAQLDWEFLIAICFTGITSGVTFRVAHAKLEKGNKPTDWSPAPEDMATQAGVESVSSNVDGKLAEMAEQSASDRKATDERLTGLETSLGDLESRFTTEQEKRRYWMDFDESAGMVIAEHGSDFRIVTTSDRQSFMYGETPMAYTSAYGFSAPNLTVTTELRIGNFLFTPHDGNLAIKFVG